MLLTPAAAWPPFSVIFAAVAIIAICAAAVPEIMGAPSDALRAREQLEEMEASGDFGDSTELGLLTMAPLVAVVVE